MLGKKKSTKLIRVAKQWKILEPVVNQERLLTLWCQDEA